MGICAYCKTTETKRTSKICSDCKIVYEKSHQKLCSACNELKDWSDFGKSPTQLFLLQCICKRCKSIKKYNRFNECEDSFFGRLFSSCKSNLKNKNKKRDLGVMTLTLDQLKAKWVKQNQKCQISHVQMATGTNVHFKASPERLDNNITYTDENVVLIIAELNTVKQFTREFLLDMCTPDLAPHPQLDEINKLNEKTTLKKFIPPPLLTKLNTSGEILNQCSRCLEFCELKAFRFNNKARGILERACNECERAMARAKTKAIEGKMKQILKHAKNATIKRNANENRDQTTYDFSKEAFVNLLQKQQGKCRLSGKNMGFDGSKPFHISLERIDVNIGYNPENVMLICEELNTSDLSAIKSLHGQQKRGHSGWNVDKFNKFRAEVNNNRSEEEKLLRVQNNLTKLCL